MSVAIWRQAGAVVLIALAAFPIAVALIICAPALAVLDAAYHLWPPAPKRPEPTTAEVAAFLRGIVGAQQQVPTIRTRGN